MQVLVTGAQGFIGKNLVARLSERPDLTVTTFLRGDDLAALPARVAVADVVVHLAGENRPADARDFEVVNAGLTRALCDAIAQSGRKPPLILASSAQAVLQNPYGASKKAAEDAVLALAQSHGIPVTIYRLPGVFGKWCRPNYNSVVATFCHNIARGLPIRIDDPATTVRLAYVDDVVSAMMAALQFSHSGAVFQEVEPQYEITLGALADQIQSFENTRKSLVSARVGQGLTRALYATYISSLPPERFLYDLPKHEDPRGVFVEMLKTHDSGQFSFFTAHPGVTRGGHYHHTKTEKFLVLKGQARFCFRHILTDERAEIVTSGAQPQIVETIPGWAHDVTNIGEDEMIVMLWANEIFDRDKPDTIMSKV